MKLKGIDGDPHKRWSMWFNSKQREEPYQVLTSFTPVIEPAFDSSFLSVRSLASGIPNSHGVTGGVYKTRERIHRSILICDY